MPKRADETFTEYMARSRDAQPMVARCVCGHVEEGPAGEVREAMRAHREAEHPELPATTPRRSRKKVAVCTTDGCGNPRAGRQGRYYGKCLGCCERIRADLEREREAARALKARERPPRRARVRAPRPAAPRRRKREHGPPPWLDEARALYEGGLSAIAIAERKHREWGYASASSCASRIYEVFRAAGVPRRTKREAARMAEARSGPGRPSLVSPPRLAAARRLYEAGLTIPQVAALAWERWGYASSSACAVGIGKMFRREGWATRQARYGDVPELNRREALALLEEAEPGSKGTAESVIVAPDRAGEQEDEMENGNGRTPALSAQEPEAEHGGEELLADLARGQAGRMILDGLGVESLGELRRLVELGRADELGVRPRGPLS